MSAVTYPTIVEAVQKAASGYGVQRLAGEMDMRPASLYNVLNPWGDRTTVKLGVEQMVYIMKQTNDFSALHLLARECGYRVESAKVEPSQSDTRDEMLEDNQALVDMQTAVRLGKPMKTVSMLADAAHKEIDETVEQYRREQHW